MAYLFLFSFITYDLVYNYTTSQSVLEVVLWICSFGYVTNEVIEFIDSPGEYFSTFTNYFDILISFCWTILFFLRFVYNPDSQLKYTPDGELDETRTRNQVLPEIYMAAWSLLCVLLWSRVVSLLQISRGPGPLIRMIMNMLKDIVNFFSICALFLIGFSFASYYIIAKGMDNVKVLLIFFLMFCLSFIGSMCFCGFCGLNVDLMDVDDVKLGTLSSVSLYIFQTLLGQQDWEKLDSVEGQFDSNRSNMVLSLVLLFSVIGSILLLNLLIAMMASTYEAVKEKSNSELNKQRIEKTFELDRARNVIPPPLNVIAFVMYGYWASFELMAWVLTFGHKQWNEEYMCPLNKGKTQYSVGDTVYFDFTKTNPETGMEEIEEVHGVVTVRQTVAQRMEGINVQIKAAGGISVSPVSSNNFSGDFSEREEKKGLSWTLQAYDIKSGITHKLLDEEIKRVEKPLFKVCFSFNLLTKKYISHGCDVM